MPDRFETLRFQQPFRKYQTMILDLVQSKWEQDHKFHLVAPPGAGKTIVGIELICRFGHPAVVFAPTSTIQAQWQEKVGLFLPDSAQRSQWAGTDSDNLRPINIFTYQLISTPGENLEHLRALAEADWVETLLTEGKAADEAAAHVRLRTLSENNPEAYEAEIRKRYTRRKREALRDAKFDSTSILHANARALIDRLVSYGVRTVVLDECHHLLDYWAIVLKELIRRIGDPYVVGLTATLPDSDSDEEYENYTGLLGDVDFEVPTPAVVKEGSLAPYRDLVLFCEPTEREHDYLNDIQSAFERALHAITDSDRFAKWVAATLLYRSPEVWLNFVNEKPLLATAGIKYLKLRQQPLPADLPLLDEMDAPMALEDWANLLEPFGLDVLKISSDPNDHRLLADLEKAIAPFGISLTERGLRQGRAPGDLVLALSESKDAATVQILQAEQKALGAQLRAVVITDYEKVSARARRLKDVLDPDAGSAARLFRALVADVDLNALDAILVTGTAVLLDSDHGEEMLTAMRKWIGDRNLDTDISYEGTDDDKVMALTGTGRGWTSRTYVQLITAMFEQGYTRCLVGTRGIFGEGWDALGLNTLIDLTAVTTSTGVNQLRGRTIRLDPSWDRKVAHNWDVVCVARGFERGDSDLKRFVRKHHHYWGVAEAGRTDSGEAGIGQIAKGAVHVDSELAFDLETRTFTEINFDKHNRHMLSRATPDSRIASYDLWGIGQAYENSTHTVTRLEAREINFLTAHTVQNTLGQLRRELIVVGLGAGVLLGSCLCGLAATPAWGLIPLFVVIPLWLIGAPLIGLSLRHGYQLYTKATSEIRPAAALLDMGQAVLAGLREVGLVSRSLTDEQVRIRSNDDGNFEIFVDSPVPEASDLFARAYRQVLGPILEPRYLITRDVSTLTDPILQAVWAFARRLTRQAPPEMVYHPVPDVLAANKQRAEAFAAHWRTYVGGGELIFTKNEPGRIILSKARTQRRPRVKHMAFEVWR